MSHDVYVIELDSATLEERKFREANPQHDRRMDCLYVGETGKSRAKRFDEHKSGIKANKYVRRYGLRLRADLHRHYEFERCPEAREAEVELAQELRAKGYAVWQH